MNAKIATGLFALTLMFTGTAKAEVLQDGRYFFSNASQKMRWDIKKVGMQGKDGIYEIWYNGEQRLETENANDGTQVGADLGKGTKWVLHWNGNKDTGGWTVHHKDNAANVISNIDGVLKLRRANAGGRGNADQIWKHKVFVRGE